MTAQDEDSGQTDTQRPPASAGTRRARRKRQTQAATQSPPRADAAAPRFPIVGIGASAGGFDSLVKLLQAMPDRPGFALVVVQHLAPDKASLAPELLARHTSMNVCEVADQPHVAVNHVYVIPPGKYLSISGGELQLSEPEEPRGRRMAIDHFLRTLAEDQKQRAVAVILSGTGTDGSLGIKAVKQYGGMVIAQEPTTAQHEWMPRSAISTGAVDHVLAPEQMPDVLMKYAAHPYVRDAEPAAADEDQGGETAARKQVPSDGLNSILALLRARTRHDFRSYKDKTLIRRTSRRMCLNHFDNYEAYLEYLREHPAEVDALVRDLLISVTDFFRDADAWKELQERMIRPLVERKSDEESIRAWVPGCATGEEPYSLAIVLLEELQRAKKTSLLQMFASDVDKFALDEGRQGTYPTSIEVDVSPERLERFFVKGDGDDVFRVNKALRDAVVFAEQNLISDPPFSKLDLICCRNVLIYLKPDVQEKIISLFHFALAEGGSLFLGNSETIGRQTDLFETVDKRWRLYRRIGPTRPDRVEIPVSGIVGRRRGGPPLSAAQQEDARLAHIAQQYLLDWLAPTAVLIDQNWRMLYISGDVDGYLTRAPGMPNDNLLENCRRGLRTRLRGAVHKAFHEDHSVTVVVRVEQGGSYRPVRLTVRPLHSRDEARRLALLIFEDDSAASARSGVEGTPRTAKTPAEGAGGNSDHAEIDDSAVVRQLEDELTSARSELQATVEQLETSNEEFKASNEEVMSVNEELQSTNEELETSKEELQSLNEELSTVNHQLSAKLEELETKHSDLQNLVAVTDVATVCLDTQMCIRWSTPAAKRVIRLSDSDQGRPLSDLSHDLVEDDLADAATQVLNRLVPLETEVHCRDDRHFLRRVTPYRTDDHRIGGVVITFIDITERKQHENALRAARDQLADELQDMQHLHAVSTRLVGDMNLDSLLQEVVSAAVAISHADMGTLQLLDEPGGKLHIVAHVGFERPFLEYFEAVESHSAASCGAALAQGERVVVRDVRTSPVFDGERVQQVLAVAGVRAVQSTPLVSRSGRMVGVVSTHFREARELDEGALRRLDLLARQTTDLIERSRAEEALRAQKERLRLLWEAAAVLLGTEDPDAMLRDLFGRIAPDFGLDASVRYVVNDAGNALELASHIGVTDKEAAQIGRLEFDQGVCGYVAVHRSPIVAAHIQQSDDPRLQRVKAFGVRAYGCFPLVAEDRLLGTLSFASRSRDEFSPDEIGFLETICHYMTAAYERVNLIQRLREADRRKDEFLAILAHELRNPLAPIRSGLDVMKMAGDEPETVAEVRDVMERQVSQMTRLIDDLLDVSRISRGRLQLHQVAVELSEIVETAVAAARPQIDEARHDLTIDLPPQPLYLYADPQRTVQVLANLLWNAAKYTPPEGRIWLSAEPLDGRVVLKVRDTGIGIAPDMQESIFEMFRQGERPGNGGAPGLGIGLTLVKSLVGMHGGTIRVESEGPGKGSEFRVELPLSKVPPPPGGRKSSHTPAAPQSTRKHRILVVDDNTSALTTLQKSIELLGHDVRVAGDGEEALRVAEEFRPELVFMDIAMPRTSGYEAARQMRQRPWGREIVLVALTGFGQPTDKEKARAAGFDHHVTKPGEPGAVQALINALAEPRDQPA